MAADFRNRPVLEPIVAQHAEGAAALWLLRDGAVDAPDYEPHHLARLEERVEAHLDGLRVAGEAGWRLAWALVDRYGERDTLFAPAVLALESRDPARLAAVEAVAETRPEALPGLVGALGWCPVETIGPTVRDWAGGSSPLHRTLLLAACSVHRADPGRVLGARLDDPEPTVRARALRLAGELGRADLLPGVLGHLPDPDPEAASRAAWSGVLLGDRGDALAALLRLAEGEGPRKWDSCEVACHAMDRPQAHGWVRRLNGDPRHARLVVVALGHIGDPAAIPWLKARQGDGALADAVAESLRRLSAGGGAGDQASRRERAIDAALLAPAARLDNWKGRVAPVRAGVPGSR